MLKGVVPFCSASLKPTKPPTLPSNMTVDEHLEQPGVAPLQLANDAAMRHKTRAARKVMFLSF
jgi:hypothetical protein